MLGAVFLIVCYSLIQSSRSPVSKVTTFTIGACGAFMVVSSASRSALIGASTAFLLLFILGIVNARKHTLRILALVVVATAALVVVLTKPEFLPTTVTERYVTFAKVLDSGVNADDNAAARVDMWRDVWNLYTKQYPLGTGVAPTYATGIPIDSYYFTTLLQGTLFFTLSFVVFLFSAVLIGMRNYFGRSARDFEGAVLIGLAAFVAASSLTLSPLLEPWISVSVAAYIGLNLAKCKPPMMRVAFRALGTYKEAAVGL
jgi:hypothetical protein